MGNRLIESVGLFRQSLDPCPVLLLLKVLQAWLLLAKSQEAPLRQLCWCPQCCETVQVHSQVGFTTGATPTRGSAQGSQCAACSPPHSSTAAGARGNGHAVPTCPTPSAENSQQLPSACAGVCCALLHETNTPFESKIRVSVPHSISQTLGVGAARILHVKNEGLQNLTEASACKMQVWHKDHSYPPRAGVGEVFLSLQCIEAFCSQQNSHCCAR